MKEVLKNFTFEYSSNNYIFSFVAMSADSVPSSKTNIFKTNSSIVAILELIRGAQCLIEVIRSSGEEMWRVDAAEVLRERSGLTRGLPIVLRECQQSGALGMHQHFNNPYKVGDGSIFIPDFPRYRYEWWCACFNKIKCRCGSKSS